MISDIGTFKFIIVRYVALLANSSRSLLIASIFGPSIFGVYSLLILAQQQMSMAALGIREAVSIELAGEDIQGEKFREVVNSALAVSFGVGSILIIGAFLVYELRYALSEINSILEYSYLVMLLASVSITSEILYNVCRVLEKFGRIALCELLYAFGCLGFVLLNIFGGFSLQTLLLSFLSINVVIVIILLGAIRNLIILRLNFDRILDLVRVGAPLMLLNVSTILLTSSGNYLVATYGDKIDSGLYNFAYGISLLFLLCINTVIWVKFSSVIGAFKIEKSARQIRMLIDKLRIAIVFTAILFLFGSLLYPIATELWFSAYTNSSLVFIGLLVSGYFLIAGFPENLLLLAVGRRDVLLRLSLISLSVSIGFFFVAQATQLFDEIKLSSVISMLIGCGIMFVLTVCSAAKYKGIGIWQDIGYVGVVFVMSGMIFSAWVFDLQVAIHVIALIGLVFFNLDKIMAIKRSIVFTRES